jgi:monovalent cation/hydrogen antiporter
VWNILVFLLNSLIFILIGIQLSAILSRLTGYSGRDLFVYGMLVSMVAIAVRFLWIYPATYLPRMLSERFGERNPAPPEAELFIMSWCGMRGIVSLVAALALPRELVNGEPFPQRDLIIFLTFVVIAVTLVLQGLTLAPLIRRLKVGTDWSVQGEEQRARLAMGKAAIAAIDGMAQKEDVPAEVAERIRAEFAEQVTVAVGPGVVLSPGVNLVKRLRRAAVRAERQELIRIWRDNQISDEVLHRIEESLDYQESRF